jgi:hypothetical protein
MYPIQLRFLFGESPAVIFGLFRSGADDAPAPESVACRALRAAGATVRVDDDGEPVEVELDHIADSSLLAEILRCPRLEQLKLNWCYALSDQDLKSLSVLPNLRKLSLPGASVDGSFLGAFTGHSQLEWLELDGSAVEDDSLGQVPGLPALTSLFLRYTGITDRGVEQLAGASQLEILHLDGTPTTGASLGSIRQLRKLQVLSLSAGVAGTELPKLSGMGRLRWVWLSDAVVDEESVRSLRETLNPLCSIGWRLKKS